MSLLDAFHAGVKVADQVTKPLQASVTYERDLGTDPYGTRTFAPPVQLRAIVDFKTAMVRTKEGVLTATRSTITLLDIAAVSAATGGLGIGNEDRFTLPDGDTGPTLDIAGFVDAGTGVPLATTVMLG